MATITNKKRRGEQTRRSGYAYEGGGAFRFDDYTNLPGFCSFLPGIAGPAGVPLWCMYVNRGQAVVSFGMTGKDGAIAEFLPATWAYQLVGVQGFRTFCLVDGDYFEPFQNDAASLSSQCERTMWVEADRVRLREISRVHQLQFDIEYVAAVNRPVPALLRRMQVRNLGKSTRNLRVLDGLPVMLPAAFNDLVLKKMRHISEAYAQVRLIDTHVPFYAPKVQQHDEAEVVDVRQGNFYAAWVETAQGFAPIQPVVDPHIVFGGAQDLITPRRFMEKPSLDIEDQVWENRLPCALAPVQVRLNKDQALTLYAVAGAAPNEAMVAPFIAGFVSPAAFDAISMESRELIEEVVAPAFTVSNLPLVDAYARQNFLDNVLRGGIPMMLPSKDGPRPLHVYARRHGDLERDYNDFLLAPHPLADGPGNYRDICQNRRYDVWFYPEVGDSEIRTFLDLIQADGYNPLAVTGYRWQLADVDAICPDCTPEARAQFDRLVQTPFAPGQLLGWMNEFGVAVAAPQQWLHDVLRQCATVLVASGHDGGYWIDHWTYIVDLLEAYQAVWPENVQAMLSAPGVGWFDEGACVVSRQNKSLERHGLPRQLHAVEARKVTPPPLPTVTPFAKLCALLALKALSMDRQGRGIEMEAGRPGWNDAMNGLPALFGSSLCETAEAARLARWLLDAAPEPPETDFPEHVAGMLEQAAEALTSETYDYERCAGIREVYRDTVAQGSTGCRCISGAFLGELLARIERCMLRGVEESIDPGTGLMHTYYMGRPTRWQPQLSPDGTPRLHPASQSPLVDVQEIAYTPLPLFLEGQVHRLRLLHDQPDAARTVYARVRQSALYDHELAMYKLNEPLAQMPKDIGRARTFSRGWFENESIWLHMSYKYLLELLRTGLYDEFFRDAETMLVPFMDPEVYGRSVLENSSFIACSACPDPNARGRGFIARLSGSTAEFIHIWLLLTVGPRPFRWDGAELSLRLDPVLPASWFTTHEQTIRWRGHDVRLPANSFACAFRTNTLLVYHNPERRNTYGPDAVRPISSRIGFPARREQERVSGPDAEAIRSGLHARIFVELG